MLKTEWEKKKTWTESPTLIGVQKQSCQDKREKLIFK